MTAQFYDICQSDEQPSLTDLLRFELRSLYGRILQSRKPSLNSSTKNLLHLGCGSNEIKNWINADFFSSTRKLDWMLDLRYPLNCDDNVWDGVFTEHTLEHLYPDRVAALLKELYRTMKPGAWIRVAVPDLQKYISYYHQHEVAKEFSQFRTGCEAIRTLTQDSGHISVWDGHLLSNFLELAGFINVQEVTFMQGTDKLLLQDTESRAWETLYVEAQKSNHQDG
jgi:predicted SAM-dependent methyltransferase